MSLLAATAPERAPNGDFGGRSFQGNAGPPTAMRATAPPFPGAPNIPGSGIDGGNVLRDTPGRRSDATVQYNCVVPTGPMGSQMYAETSALSGGALAFGYDDGSLDGRGRSGPDKMQRLVSYAHLASYMTSGSTIDRNDVRSAQQVNPIAGADWASNMALARLYKAKRGYGDEVQVIEAYSEYQTIPLGNVGNDGNDGITTAGPNEEFMEDSANATGARMAMRDAGLGVGSGVDGNDVPVSPEVYGNDLMSYLALPHAGSMDDIQAWLAEHKQSILPDTARPAIFEAADEDGDGVDYTDMGAFLASPFLMWRCHQTLGAANRPTNWANHKEQMDGGDFDQDTRTWGLDGPPRHKVLDAIVMQFDNASSRAIDGAAGDAPFFRADNAQERRDTVKRMMNADNIEDYADPDVCKPVEAYEKLVRMRLEERDAGGNEGINRFVPKGVVIYKYSTQGSDKQAEADMDDAQNGIYNICVQGHTLSAAFNTFATSERITATKRQKRLVTLPRDVMYVVVVARYNPFGLGAVDWKLDDTGGSAPSYGLAETEKDLGVPSLQLNPDGTTNRPVFDHIRYERTTSEEFHRMCKKRMAYEDGSFLRGDEVILGAWRLGSVVDGAASRIMPAGSSISAIGAASHGVTLSVGVRWVSSFELHERYWQPLDAMDGVDGDTLGIVNESDTPAMVKQKRQELMVTRRKKQLATRMERYATAVRNALERVTGVPLGTSMAVRNPDLDIMGTLDKGVPGAINAAPSSRSAAASATVPAAKKKTAGSSSSRPSSVQKSRPGAPAAS